MTTENTESQSLSKVVSEIQALQEVVTRFRQLRLDATEFACLKCIVTFKAGRLLLDTHICTYSISQHQFEHTRWLDYLFIFTLYIPPDFLMAIYRRES